MKIKSTIPAKLIEAGDRYYSAGGGLAWVATADAVTVPDEGDGSPGMVVVEIRHHDGGRSTRGFELDATIEIVRELD